MPNKIKNIGVLCSGGDSPGMNAAIRAVVRTCAFHNIQCTGVFRGYQGLIEGEFIALDARSVKAIINKGGTFLMSSRSPEFETPAGRQKAYNNLNQANIDALVVIGGDGSFRGALAFNQDFNFPVLGIPGTIDNDIYGTSFTLGFDTALNTAVEVIDKIRDTASSHNRLFFVEVMGRDAGHIALNVGISSGAEEILIPEEDMGLERLIESLERSKKSGKKSNIIIVSEGDKTGKNVFELKDYVEEHMPEYDARVSVLGHIQRGGSPTCFDRVLASRLGVKAVESLLDGESNCMAGILKDEIALTPFCDAIKLSAEIDQDLIRVSDILSI